MTILLGLVAFALLGPAAERHLQAATGQTQHGGSADRQPPLSGANSVSNLAVTRGSDGRFFATLDYFFTGEPERAQVTVYQMVQGSGPQPVPMLVGSVHPKRGANRHTLEIRNPNAVHMTITRQVYAVLAVPTQPPLAKAEIDHVIQWPDPVVAKVEQAVAAGRIDAIVTEAAEMIDTNQRWELQRSRALLLAVIERSPRTESAYIELARVAMKSDWQGTGLGEAETLLGSALQIRPDSVNAKILLGYVYAHQKRYKKAELLFAESAAANPPNLWLWANWAQLLVMQGKTEQAIAKYREAVARPPTGNTYDRARVDAYWHLLRLLHAGNDLDGMEALYRQRVQDYPGAECFAADHAQFLVLSRADADAGLAVLREQPSPKCDPAITREVQGLAHYVKWSQAKGPEGADLLHQARAFLPAGPSVLYALTRSERTAPTAARLIAAGHGLDVQNREQLDALALALRNADHAAARRLLKLGARPDTLIGPEQMPVALIPVLGHDFEGIRIMQRAGTDYTRLKWQGATAIEHARAIGDARLLQLLDPRQGRL